MLGKNSGVKITTTTFLFQSLILILAFLGFLISVYLTVLHYKNIAPPCSLASTCETVLTSKYATIFNIPIALLGAGYYLVLIILLSKNHNPSFLIQNSNNFANKIHFLLLSLTTLALIISFLLIGIQAFILHAFCQWCLTCEGINIIIFILFLLPRRFD